MGPRRVPSLMPLPRAGHGSGPSTGRVGSGRVQIFPYIVVRSGPIVWVCVDHLDDAECFANFSEL